MNTNDIIEHIKAKDKEIDSLRTDLQMLIYSATRLGEMIRYIDQEHKPGGANGRIDRLDKEIEKLCARYKMQQRSAF